MSIKIGEIEHKTQKAHTTNEQPCNVLYYNIILMEY